MDQTDLKTTLDLLSDMNEINTEIMLEIENSGGSDMIDHTFPDLESIESNIRSLERYIKTLKK